MKDILIKGLSQLGIVPPPGAVEQLCRYAQLLLEQNKVMNLTAITQPEDVARLHFLDSAAVLAWGNRRTSREETAGASPRPTDRNTGLSATGGAYPSPTEQDKKAVKTWLSGKSLVDVGTGAGFPGVVLKILEPSLSLTLVDSLGKRVTWLESVCEVLSLDGVRCLHVRAEELALDPSFRDGFDVSVSRAVAAYPALCELCLPYVRPGGVFLAMKSVESAPEAERGLSAVKRLGGKPLSPWDYAIPGAEVTHRILAAEKSGPTPQGYPRSWGKIKKLPL